MHRCMIFSLVMDAWNGNQVYVWRYGQLVYVCDTKLEDYFEHRVLPVLDSSAWT